MHGLGEKLRFFVRNRKYLLIVIIFLFTTCTDEKSSDFYESTLIEKDLKLIKVDEFILNDGIGSGTEK